MHSQSIGPCQTNKHKRAMRTNMPFAHVTKSLEIFPPDVLQATPTLSAVVLDKSRLLRNMCMGMKALTDSAVNSVVLTRHRDDKLNAANRRSMCKQSSGTSRCGADPKMTAPDGTPLNVPSYPGDFDFSSDFYKSKKRWYLRTECDEFPFGTSPIFPPYTQNPKCQR